MGLQPVRVALHPEVVVQVSLNIARSEDEAERQARGEDVTIVKEEGVQLETFNPDAVFEEEALTRQRGEEEQPDVPDNA
jgi:large subunit ribosomal protein L9